MITVLSVLVWITYFISLYFAVFWLTILITKKGHYPMKKLISYPKVSIVIPAYNEEKCIEKTLNVVMDLDYPLKKLEIIVVNDGSTDNTDSIVKRVVRSNPAVNIRLITQKNKGKGAALNNGLNNCNSNYFVCLDADSFVERNALKKMLPYFVNDTVAAVLPTLKVYKPRNVLQKLQWYEYLINMFYKELMGKLDCIHVTPGPFSVYSAKILKKLNGFDENNMTEDLEMAFRLQLNHYKIVQLLDTEVKTIVPETFKDLYKQRNRWFKGATLNAINYRKALFNKKYGDFGVMQMPKVLLSGALIIFIIASLFYYLIKSYVEYIANLINIHFDII